MQIYVMDVETTQKSKYGFGAWPFAPENRVVYFGSLSENPQVVSILPIDYANLPKSVPIPEPYLVVTQAGKFDLHYVRRTGDIQAYYNVGVIPDLWDIQIAEYILTGQQSKMASMDSMCLKYGFPVKDTEVKKAFEEGKGADELDPAKVTEYLKGDLHNTYGICKKQMALATPSQVNLILQMGSALQACAEMEYNGFSIDKTLLTEIKVALENRTQVLQQAVVDLLSNIVGFPVVDFNMNSRTFWSAYIFGGEYVFEWRVPDGLFKSGERVGQPRFKIHRETVEFRPLGIKRTPVSTAQGGIYKIDDRVLEEAAYLSKMVELYRQYKLLDKLRNTYVDNILENSNASFDGRLHHNLNMTTTDTARLSCSSPNMQNMPRADQGSWEKLLRSCFISRWGPNGVLIEADYKALEMVGFACLNKDPVLINDLNLGLDPHTETGKVVFGGREMTEEERVAVKKVNFGTIYGGGAEAVAEQAGINPRLAREIQRALKARYSVGFKNAADRTGLHKIVSETGRTYVTRGSYTKGMNYPIQGFCTGDLVPTMQGRLFKKLKNNERLTDECLLINQEHDKFLFDCHKSVLDEALPFIKEVMESAPEVMFEVYGIDMECRTPVSLKFGPNLGTMKKWEP